MAAPTKVDNDTTLSSSTLPHPPSRSPDKENSIPLPPHNAHLSSPMASQNAALAEIGNANGHAGANSNGNGAGSPPAGSAAAAAQGNLQAGAASNAAAAGSKKGLRPKRSAIFYPSSAAQSNQKPFSSSAAKRESVLALGSIGHLQHFYSKQGM